MSNAATTKKRTLSDASTKDSPLSEVDGRSPRRQKVSDGDLNDDKDERSPSEPKNQLEEETLPHRSHRDDIPPSPSSSAPESEEPDSDAEVAHQVPVDRAAADSAGDCSEPDPVDPGDKPPLPDEPTPPPNETAPLPDESTPSEHQDKPSQDTKAAVPEDDGWEPVWDATSQAYYFYNRFSQKTQWENPRVAVGEAGQAPPLPADGSALAVAGGYDPAIHGSYDPNADYAKAAREAAERLEQEVEAQRTHAIMMSAGNVNGLTAAALKHDPHRAQLSSYFDYESVQANDDGRSLKAERSSKKLTRSEIKAFKEKREERKRAKQRAWLQN